MDEFNKNKSSEEALEEFLSLIRKVGDEAVRKVAEKEGISLKDPGKSAQPSEAAQQQLKRFVDEVNLVADRAEQISRESSSSDFPKGKPDLVSQLEETMIRSLIEGGKARTREEAIQMLDEEM